MYKKESKLEFMWFLMIEIFASYLGFTGVLLSKFPLFLIKCGLNLREYSKNKRGK